MRATHDTVWTARRVGGGGFTLVELLIAVVILGVIAAVALPSLMNHSSEARVSVLEHNTSDLQRAVELYYHDHAGRYPAASDPMSGDALLDGAEARRIFVEQLTLASDVQGVVSTESDARFRFGPYLRAIPLNPLNGRNDVRCDVLETSITAVAPSLPASGWKFYARTGVVIANHADSKALEETEALPVD